MYMRDWVRAKLLPPVSIELYALPKLCRVTGRVHAIFTSWLDGILTGLVIPH